MAGETLTDLMMTIERATPEGGDWCSVSKAQTLAALIVALRPQRVLEVGVWMGGSMIPMLLALQHLQTGSGIAIDAWSPNASIKGQNGDNESWWGSVNHDAAYKKFMDRLARHNLQSLCVVIRKASDDVAGMDADFVHIDGNHGDQAIRDVQKFAPRIPVGGILVLDDLDWEGGAVRDARQIAKDLGFVDMYPLGTGVVMRRATSSVLAAGVSHG